MYLLPKFKINGDSIRKLIQTNSLRSWPADHTGPLEQRTMTLRLSTPVVKLSRKASSMLSDKAFLQYQKGMYK